MAGSNPTFKAGQFRSAIRFVFDMAAPPVAADQLRFHFNPTTTSVAARDGDGVPFDPAAAVVVAQRPPLQRPCLVEYVDAAEDPTAFGTVVPSKLRVTLLDEDYAYVKDADYVMIGGDRYLRHHEPPSYGLFDVGLHTLYFAAENEL